jgi:hypothetical protein
MPIAKYDDPLIDYDSISTEYDGVYLAAGIEIELRLPNRNIEISTINKEVELITVKKDMVLLLPDRAIPLIQKRTNNITIRKQNI